MEDKKILQFKQQIQNFSLEQLKTKQQEIQSAISKMILDSDLIIEAAIVEAAIKEKEETNGKTN